MMEKGRMIGRLVRECVSMCHGVMRWDISAGRFISVESRTNRASSRSFPLVTSEASATGRKWWTEEGRET